MAVVARGGGCIRDELGEYVSPGADGGGKGDFGSGNDGNYADWNRWDRLLEGHRDVTLVYPINEGCQLRLSIGKDRTEAGLRGFFAPLSEEVKRGIQFVCSEMWQP
ncbi:MAG: hypothetical protein ACK5UC_24855 [Planctomycetaceae bacterium]